MLVGDKKNFYLKQEDWWNWIKLMVKSSQAKGLDRPIGILENSLYDNGYAIALNSLGFYYEFYKNKQDVFPHQVDPLVYENAAIRRVTSRAFVQTYFPRKADDELWCARMETHHGMGLRRCACCLTIKNISNIDGSPDAFVSMPRTFTKSHHAKTRLVYNKDAFTNTKASVSPICKDCWSIHKHNGRRSGVGRAYVPIKYGVWLSHEINAAQVMYDSLDRTWCKVNLPFDYSERPNQPRTKSYLLTVAKNITGYDYFMDQQNRIEVEVNLHDA